MTPFSRFDWASTLTTLALFLAGRGVEARQASGETAAHQQAIEAIDNELAQLDSERENQSPAGESSELDKRLEELVASTRSSLQAARDAEERALASLKSAEEARRLLPGVEAELDRPVIESAPFVPRDMMLEEVLQGSAVAEARLTGLRNEAESLSNAARAREERRLQLPELLSSAKAELTSRTTLEKAPLPVELGPQERQTLERARAAETRAAAAKATALEIELAGLAAREQYESMQAQLVDRRIAGASRTLAAWREAAEERRQRETVKAQREVDAATRRARAVDPALTGDAEFNAELASDLLTLVRANENLTHDTHETGALLEKVTAAYGDAERRSLAAGLRGSVGALLRRQKAELPALGEHRRRVSSYESRLAEVRLQRFDWEDALEELEELAAQQQLLDGMVAALPPDSSPDLQKRVRAEGRELLSTRRGYLNRLLVEAEGLSQHLEEGEKVERDLVRQVDAFSDYINKRVFWIRSQGPFWTGGYTEAPRGLLWILNPKNWLEAARSLLRSASEWAGTTGLGLALLAGLFLLRKRLRKQLDPPEGMGVTQYSSLSLRPTIEASVATLGLTLFLPGLLALLAWLWITDLEATEFARALGLGLRGALPFVLLVQFLRHLWRPGGLAEGHFHWPSVTQRRRNMRLLSLCMPLWVLVQVYEAHGKVAWIESLGSPALLGVLALFATFGLRASRSSSVLAWKGPWARVVWLVGASGVLVLCGAALLGYTYTSTELLRRVMVSAWVVVGAALLHALFEKWLLIAKAYMAQRQAREIRDARRAAAKAAGPAESAEPEIDTEPRFDLAEIGAQTRQLLNSFIAVALVMSLAGIWAEVLPALSVFDSVGLWKHMAPDARPTDPEVWVTLWDLMRSLAILAITFVAGRNLPGFLEVVLLQRMRVSAGQRYAATAVARYVIVVVGVVLAFGALGIGWSKVQWLVAAMTVGLGFGMQEIFANFVSGLILLFEQPIRVGDWVSIGDIDGKVVRIQMRATSIIDRDLKELIVPNKDFVTGRLINWTLSNPVSRVVLPVGVAYGSDTEKATRLLLDIARHDPNVLKDPPPSVVFKSFGDSSLDMQLRVFIDDRDKYPAILHPLNTAIHKLFAEAGIEIAFPQRDLHLRSVKPLERFLEGLEPDRVTSTEPRP